jgi:hypothetical protein
MKCSIRAGVIPSLLFRVEDYAILLFVDSVHKQNMPVVSDYRHISPKLQLRTAAFIKTYDRSFIPSYSPSLIPPFATNPSNGA